MSEYNKLVQKEYMSRNVEREEGDPGGIMQKTKISPQSQMTHSQTRNSPGLFFFLFFFFRILEWKQIPPSCREDQS